MFLRENLIDYVDSFKNLAIASSLSLSLPHVKKHSIVRFKCSQRIYYRAGGENNDRQWHFGVGMFFLFSSVSRCKANGVRNKFLFLWFLL